MRTIEDVKDQQQLIADLRASSDPAAAARADALQGQYYREQMGLLSEDVDESARGEGQPPAGWVRASEHLPMLRQEMPELTDVSDTRLREMLKPRESGFRAEIYLPDPAILGPGYKPTAVFKGSNGEVLQADGTRRETGPEDFGANNFPQAIGQKTDYYDRAMELADTLRDLGARVDYAGHSLGGGLASAAVAVSGERGTTFNAAGLHPETALRFQRENPGTELFDPNGRIVAHQVRGEVLTDGLQNNVERMDVAQRRVLGGVLKETSDLVQDVPQLKQALEQQLQSMDMPRHAKKAITGFVDALAEGDTDKMLRDMPLASGEIRPLEAKMRVDGRIVDRPSELPLDEVTALAGPTLRALRVVGAGAHLGHEAGEVVQTAGHVAQRTLDTSGDVVRAGGDKASNVVSAVAGGIESLACDTSESLAETAAKTRVAAGAVEAKVDELKADAVIAARTGEGVLWQSVASLAPDGSQLERFAERRADQTIAENVRTERAGEVAALAAKQEAARDATAIRGAADDACNVLETIHVTGVKIQRGTVETATRFVDTTLDSAGNRIKGATEYGPAAGAALGGTVAANAYLNPMSNPASYPILAELGKTLPEFSKNVMPASGEATERHLMSATVIPSMQLTTDGMEAEAKQWLNTHQRTQAAAPLLDHPTHPNHGMYAKLLEVVQERDRALGRTPDEFSKQLAGALTERALSQGLTTIGAAKFSDDGKTVGMTDTPNLYAEWARTSAGNAAELAGRPLAQSSEGATKLNDQIEQARALQAQNQTQTPPTQDDPGPKGPKL